MLGPRATVIIASVVTGVWALNFLAGLFIRSYHPDQSINGIFMAVVGGLIALGGKRERETHKRHHNRHTRDQGYEEDEEDERSVPDDYRLPRDHHSRGDDG